MGLKVEMVDMKSRKPQGTADLNHTFLPQSLTCFFKLHAVFPPVGSSAWWLLGVYRRLTSICELQELCGHEKAESTCNSPALQLQEKLEKCRLKTQRLDG